MQSLVEEFNQLSHSSKREDNSLCSNIPALEFHYTESVQNLIPFVCDDEERLISCFNSSLFYYFSPLKEELELMILVACGQNIQQVNKRMIRFFSTRLSAPLGWERKKVRIRQGTNCFLYRDCCTTFLMTEEKILELEGCFVI